MDFCLERGESRTGTYFPSTVTMRSSNDPSPLKSPQIIIKEEISLMDPPKSSSLVNGKNPTRADSETRAQNGDYQVYNPTTEGPEAANSLAGVLTSDKAYLSPGLGSRSSICSGHSTDSCSYSIASSSYLTPPETNIDLETPPYKSRLARSISLTMVNSKFQTISDVSGLKATAKPQRLKNQKNGGCGCSHNLVKLDEHKKKSYWWLPATKTQHKSTAASGIQKGKDTNSRTQNLNPSNNNGERTPPVSLKSTQATPFVSRRWSSVGFETAKCPHRSVLSRNLNGDQLPSPCRDRSRTWTEGVRKRNVVRAVRDCLTSRRVSTQHMETPATITLRRASTASSPGISSNQASNPPSHVAGASGTLHNWQRAGQRIPVLAYLITNKDVDSISDLIETTFQDWMRELKSSRLSKPHRKVSSAAYQQPRRPSVTQDGLLPGRSGAASQTTTIADIHRVTDSPDSYGGLAVSPKVQRNLSTASVTYSLTSIHETIWEDDGSPGSWSSSPRTPNSEDEKSSNLGFMHHPVQNNETVEKALSLPHYAEDNIFSTSASTSKPVLDPIHRWSWKSGQNEDNMSSTSSETLQSPTVRKRSSNVMITVATRQPDVVSFPPLPSRKTTGDWISPLPDIEALAISGEQNSLYAAGIDATIGPHTAHLTPLVTTSFWDTASKKSPTNPATWGGTSFWDNQLEVAAVKHARLSDNDLRRKSVVLNHPQAQPRTGHRHMLGSLIGSSTGVRRESSTRATMLGFEHCNKKDLKKDVNGREPWTKARKDSGWPVLNFTSSQEQLERAMSSESSRSHSLSPHQIKSNVVKEKKKRHEVDRMILINERSPLLSSTDHVGIYTTLTGTESGSDAVENGSQRHECGDSPLESRQPSFDWIG